MSANMAHAVAHAVRGRFSSRHRSNLFRYFKRESRRACPTRVAAANSRSILMPELCFGSNSVHWQAI